MHIFVDFLLDLLSTIYLFVTGERPGISSVCGKVSLENLLSMQYEYYNVINVKIIYFLLSWYQQSGKSFARADSIKLRDGFVHPAPIQEAWLVTGAPTNQKLDSQEHILTHGSYEDLREDKDLERDDHLVEYFHQVS